MVSGPENREEHLPGGPAARLEKVVDVMRVRPTGDPTEAIVEVRPPIEPRAVECDVLVVGGGTGGSAAAWAAARLGRSVCIVEETDWLGGQFTAQGVSALDEHEYIERFGGTRSYYSLRDAIRRHYQGLAARSARMDSTFNPGNCWVSRLAFEPRVAVAVLDRIIAPYVENARLSVFYRSKAVAVGMGGDRIHDVLVTSLLTGDQIRFLPSLVIDATELGDLLPLAGAEYVVGAEAASETGEAHAQPMEAKRHCVQSFTYTFAAELHAAGQGHIIAKPDAYELFRERQPYTLRIHVSGGEIYSDESGWLEYEVLERAPGTKGSLWAYRRLIDRDLFPGRFPNDVSMFNWPGNDYRDASLLDQQPAQLAAALQGAKRVSLGFLYWLQTEAPFEGRAHGFPEIRLRADVMDSVDGLSKHPYIREARRIRARATVREQDLSATDQPGPRARHFSDSVGVGWYPIDIHRAGPDDMGASCRTRPFQIPLGALIPVRIQNLVAAGKNIGTTHITNGCFRLHPVEWNIGESAGVLAAFALEHGRSPARVRDEPALLRRLQRSLLDEGIPLCWYVDVPVSSPDFAAVQQLGMLIEGRDELEFRGGARLTDAERSSWVTAAMRQGYSRPYEGASTRLEFASDLARASNG